MNPALALLVTAVIVGMGFALVTVFGMYGKAKLKAARLEDEVARLKTAIGVGQGYLENLSTSEIPGASDGAYTALARIDSMMREKS